MTNAVTGQTITATVQNAGGLNLVVPGDGTTSTTVDTTVQPSALGDFVIEKDGGGPLGSVQANASVAIQITAHDVFWNPSASGPNNFSGAGNTVELTSTVAGSLGLGTTPAFTNGVLSGRLVRLSELGAGVALTAAEPAGPDPGPPAVSRRSPSWHRRTRSSRA